MPTVRKMLQVSQLELFWLIAISTTRRIKLSIIDFPKNKMYVLFKRNSVSCSLCFIRHLKTKRDNTHTQQHILFLLRKKTLNESDKSKHSSLSAWTQFLQGNLFSNCVFSEVTKDMCPMKCMLA